MQHRRVYIYIIISLMAIACSTDRNTWYSRHYQALNSNFNVYFNGKEAFKSGINTIRTQYKNDYSSILPVYEFSNKETAKSADADMETALKKAHKLIQLHSITVKPEKKENMTERQKRLYAKEEFNPYVDDAYLLIGMANVVKHSEEEAIEIFDFISRKFPTDDTNYEGKIWKSIAYCQLGQYTNAQSALESYDLDGIAPASLFGKYMAAYANVYICQKQYAEAIEYMEKAITDASDRHERNRYKYILAQLYRLNGEKEKAAPLFMELSRLMNDYDMAFAAKLDLATVATTPGELATAEKKLNKMAADEKNVEQLDQIYYAIGKMNESKGLGNTALNNYKQSVEASVSNDNQKGLSFLAMADIFIERPIYIEASESLDSAAYYLDDNNARKKEATTKAAIYNPLANELRIIKEKDSLLRVANMDEKERDKFIDKILEEHERAERLKQEAIEAEQDEYMSQNEFNQLNRNNNSASASQWYFYNTTMVSTGKTTFISKWGRRKNEDNWRRSDKSTMSISSEEAESMFGGDADNQSNTDKNTNNESKKNDEAKESSRPSKITRESLLAGLPLTEQQKSEANKAIETALFNSGTILYQDITDYRTSIKQLSTLNKKYPQSKNRYDALVILYFAHVKNGDESSAKDVARTIMNEYANSSFAQYLNTPDYFTQQGIEKAEKEAHYEQTYNSYLRGELDNAINLASTAIGNEADSAYRAKYLLIRSLSYAKQAQTTSFKADLLRITDEYKGGEEDSIAVKLLALLDEGRTPVKSTPYESPIANGNSLSEEDQSLVDEYVYRPDTTHTLVCVIDNGMKNEAQFTIADYNFTNYLIEDLDISAINMADRRQVILISGFNNKIEAMNYYYAIRDKEFWKQITSASVPEIYVSSDNNVRVILLTSIDDNYKQFFTDNYINKKITE